MTSIRLRSPFVELMDAMLEKNAASSKCCDTPATNIVEHENGYALEVSIPGFTKEQVSIDVNEQILTVSGRVPEVSEEKSAEETKHYRMVGFKTKDFTVRFKLPRLVDSDRIRASIENGILYIHIPREEEAQKFEKKILIA